MNNEVFEAARKSLHIEGKAIEDLIKYLDKDKFLKAVDVLSKSERIVTCASGSSGIAAKKFAHSLCCIERSAMFLSPCEAIHGGLGYLKKNDVMVMVSRGGKTAELLPVIHVCNKKEAFLIGITENLDSPLGRNSDIVLQMKVESESDPIGLMATSSFVITIALFDALLASLIVKTKFTKEQFALIHPGGAVGQLLNT